MFTCVGMRLHCVREIILVQMFHGNSENEELSKEIINTF